MDSLFGLGRNRPFPAIYKELKTAVSEDVLITGWIVSIFAGFFCFLFLLPAVLRSQRWLYFLRIILFAFVGIVIMCCNFGQQWEVGEVTSQMFYKAGSSAEINATIGIKIGLRSVNITLYAYPESLTHPDVRNEKINYNERFIWTWDQGRAGFGPFAGQIQRDYRAAQLRGAPYPILWVADYFTVDGEGLRFGRYYRQAGWYSHIAIWCAFCSGILSLLLFKVFIPYGALMWATTGAFLLLASLIWCFLRNHIELGVIFNNQEITGVLRTKYGVHWYLSLIVGIFCIVTGFLIFVLNPYFYDFFCKFFGVDPYGLVDEEFQDDVEPIQQNKSDELEMQEKGQFKSARRRTFIYTARRNKNRWIKEGEVESSDYTDNKILPKEDEEYLTFPPDKFHAMCFDGAYRSQHNPQPLQSSAPIPDFSGEDLYQNVEPINQGARQQEHSYLQQPLQSYNDLQQQVLQRQVRGNQYNHPQHQSQREQMGRHQQHQFQRQQNQW